MSDSYNFTLADSQYTTLLFALGVATGAAMKEGCTKMGQMFFDLANDFAKQANGDKPNGETSNVAPNQVATDGTD